MARLLIVGDKRSVDDVRTLLGPGHDLQRVTSSNLEAGAPIRACDLMVVDLRRRSAAEGIDAALCLRKRQDVPVVFVTAPSNAVAIARAGKTEPFGYLLAPFTAEEFKHAVDDMLHRRGLRHPFEKREHWLSTTLKSVGDAIVATDCEGRITFMNAMAERLTGWSEMEANGKASEDVLRLVSAASGARIENPIARVRATGGAVILERGALLRTRSGAEIPIDDSVAPISDGSLMLGVVVVFRDISERKKLESRLALSERLAGFGAITAGISHEINNPLAYNLANCQIALREVAALRSEFARAPLRDTSLVLHLEILEKALHDAQDGAERVRRIVSDVKALFAPADRESHAKFAVVSVLETATRIAWNEIKHRARFVRDLRANPHAYGSEAQLVQVLVNLLINAAQAIAEGKIEDNEIRLALDIDATGACVIEVHDTGVGIPPEVMVHIFDPFFTTKPNGTGTGLGLSISHDLLEAQGGTLTAESAVGKGSVFRVRLPTCEPESLLASHTPKPVAPTLKPRARVLIVDDEPILTSALRQILKPAHDVTIAENADLAQAMLESGKRFDLILCDVMMPGMSVLEFYTLLRSKLPDQAERVVFVTGGAFTPETRAFMEQFPKGRVLTKPFGFDALEALVESAVGSSLTGSRHEPVESA